MKKILILVAGIVLGSTLSVTFAGIKESNSSRTVSISNASSTAPTRPATKIYVFDTDYSEQTSCIKIKDSSGGGYTYLVTDDGVGTFSKTSCE